MKQKTKYKEPAKVSYFFGDSYRDLGETIADAWSDNFDDIKKAALDFKGVWGSHNWYVALCLTIFRAVILVSIALFGTIFTAIFSFIHIIVIAILSLSVYIGFVFMRVVDMIFCWFKGLSTNCYNPGCSRKFTLPYYVCPKCKKLHHKLVPSKYGILKRTCECGEKLPTTFINGRQKLNSVCPYCQCETIKGIHKSILIPVIGGVNAGKTCFINMAINEIEKKSPAIDLEFQYQHVHGDVYDENKKRIGSGHCPEKTTGDTFKYYNFYLTPKGVKVNNLISICDIAGEVFDDQTKLNKQQGYRFADGLIAVIDPMAILEFNNEIKRTLSAKEYSELNQSKKSLNDILSGIINTMEGLYRLKAKDTINKPIMIVFTKSDIPGLSEKIGGKAVEKYISSHEKMTEYEAENILCEQFLMEYGESNFLNALKTKFKQVQFFACSALGHNEDGKEFSPDNVEMPMLWIIDKLSRSIELSSIWGKKI